MRELSDEELLQRHRAAGSSPMGRAFIDELFQRHHARVASWCFRMTGDLDSAADLAQEVFLKAFQRLDSYRGTSKFTTWIYSIARNHCMDELRSRAARPTETIGPALDEMADSALEEVLLSLERRESQDAVRQIMRESLDETEAKVMTLHYVHELPLDSITRLMGFTNQSGSKAYIVSAKRKLSRALGKLRGSGQGAKGGRYGF